MTEINSDRVRQAETYFLGKLEKLGVDHPAISPKEAVAALLLVTASLMRELGMSMENALGAAATAIGSAYGVSVQMLSGDALAMLQTTGKETVH